MTKFFNLHLWGKYTNIYPAFELPSPNHVTNSDAKAGTTTMLPITLAELAIGQTSQELICDTVKMYFTAPRYTGVIPASYAGPD